MKSFPYSGVSDKVRSAVQDVLHGADEYHTVHTARLARTIEILYSNTEDNVPLQMLELGTSGFVPLVCEKLLPNVSVTGTVHQTEKVSSQDVDFRVGRYDTRVHCHGLDLEYSKIPEDGETFDIVLCCEVLEHMEIDPMFMLAEVNRVMKTGGTLILTTPNILSSRALHKMLHGESPYFYMQYHRNREYNRHNYEYNLKTLRSVLKAAGFIGDVLSEDLFEDGIPEIVRKLHDSGFPVQHTGDNLIAIMRKTFDVVNRYPASIYI